MRQMKEKETKRYSPFTAPAWLRACVCVCVSASLFSPLIDSLRQQRIRNRKGRQMFRVHKPGYDSSGVE